MSDRRDASEHTLAANAALLEHLPFEDRRDFEDAARGFIAPLGAAGSVVAANGFPTWDAEAFSFVSEDAPCPPTVNPSLWRQSQLLMKGGLFRVTDRMYQVRNADLSNLTVVEGDTGLIVFDPLITTETASAALDLYFEHRPRKPVVAVLYSHSHVDHYGGVKGVVSADDVASGKVRVIAPEGFLEAAVSENVLAGNAMARRATWMYGWLLPRDPKGNVGVGLGMATSLGTVTLIPPTETITDEEQTLEIDGLTFEFMLAPDTEAPAEMHWFIPELGALTAAENCCHTLHNTYTLRGAPIRDPRSWSHYLNRTIERWGDRTEVLYGMHHWPVWGPERAVEMLGKGRDAYRFINDETLRLANHGYTPVEIGEMIRLPDRLQRHWAVRDYYGTVNHNVKATYVKYLGWFDGNPAHLHPHPHERTAPRYVELMGGADRVLAASRAAFDEGDYRWVAEVVNHVVFADPTNVEARALQADALEQLGYQAESGPWRNFYLSAALELRGGTPRLPAPNPTSSDTVGAMNLAMFLDWLGVRLDGARAATEDLAFNLEITDTAENAFVEVSNGTISYALGRHDERAGLSVALTRDALTEFVRDSASLDAAIEDGTVTVTGDREQLTKLAGLLDTFPFWFPIIEP